MQLSAWCLYLVESSAYQICVEENSLIPSLPTQSQLVLLLEHSPPLNMVFLFPLVCANLQDSSLVSFSPLLPSSNPSSVPLGSMSKMFLYSNLFLATQRPPNSSNCHHLPLNNSDTTQVVSQSTLFSGHWDTVHKFCFREGLLIQKLGLISAPFRVTLASENCLTPDHTSSWASPYPVTLECGDMTVQISQYHWTTLKDHFSL